MKTYSAKPLEVERKWYLIDAEGEILGRLAARVANILRLLLLTGYRHVQQHMSEKMSLSSAVDMRYIRSFRGWNYIW